MDDPSLAPMAAPAQATVQPTEVMKEFSECRASYIYANKIRFCAETLLSFVALLSFLDHAPPTSLLNPFMHIHRVDLQRSN